MDCPATIVINGAGDIGSAVAVFAFRQGCRVVIRDEAQPAWTRRGMAFTDVFFDDAAELWCVLVQEKAKVIKVDRRGEPAACFGVGQRPCVIAAALIVFLGADLGLPLQGQPERRDLPHDCRRAIS
jgi:hypothetical protein